MKEENRVTLCTFPDDDADYCKVFDVPKKWLLNLLKRHDEKGEKKANLEDFLESYVWEETWFIYLQAKKEGRLICEEEER